MSSPTPAEPGPEPAAEQDAAAETTAAEPKPRLRGRTAKIMVAAVALGILCGAGTGYAVQAARKPTPLPPLAVTQPAYPTAHSAAPALAAAEDDMVKTDGDLTKLLVPIPSGGKPWNTPISSDGWYDLYSLASNYTKPASELKYQLEHGFRRAAVQTWMQGSVSYEVDLIQYRHDKEESTQQFIQDQVQYAREDAWASLPLTLPHSTAEYGVYAGPHVLHHTDGSSYYRAYGFAAHGDVVVEVMVFSPDRIAPAPLLTLLQNQMERL